jgi:prephenate dehydratase
MTRVATLGPEGSFSEEAAIRYGEGLDELQIQLRDDPEKILSLDEVDLGIVAIENSLGGSIGPTLDLLGSTPNVICGEIVLRIRHFLMASSDSSDVERIFSHPAALAQCKRLLKERFGESELVAVSSTAEGARRASKDPSSAAVGSLRAADIYGLRVLARDIQDRESHTRFVVVGRSSPPPTGSDKTSVIFDVKDQPGALHKALTPFARRGLNLTKIESRPSRGGLGQYLFYVDFDGHAADKDVEDALRDLSPLCTSVKVLGSYPAATSPQHPSK